MSQETLTRQTGLSLIELMISLTLGIFLIFGVLEVFVNSKQTYRVQDSLSRLQENARFAIDTIVTDIRGAGYIGCNTLTATPPRVAASSTPITDYTLDNVFNGHQNTGGSTWVPNTLPANLGDKVDDSDIFTIQSAGRCTAPLTAEMGGTNDNITIAADNPCGFERDAVVMVSDCNSSDIFRISNTVGTSGSLNPENDLGSSYLASTAGEVISVKSATYFIRNDNDVPTLFMLDNNKAAGDDNPIALIEGVENIQIQFGIDNNNDGTPDQYENAANDTNWPDVVTSRITLLMRTIEPVGADDFDFDVGGTTATLGGGFLRKSFVSTVQLRNRGL